MTDPDWSEVECRLRRAYWSLKAAVAGGEPESGAETLARLPSRHKKAPDDAGAFELPMI